MAKTTFKISLDLGMVSRTDAEDVERRLRNGIRRVGGWVLEWSDISLEDDSTYIDMVLVYDWDWIAFDELEDFFNRLVRIAGIDLGDLYIE